MWQRRSECPKKKTCLVATDAATSLTIANAYAPIAAKLLAATAAQATAEQQADKGSFFAHCYSGCEKKWQ
jgi:hypothetical protein